MQYGRLFVLFGALSLIIVTGVIFSMSRLELFNISSRVLSNCDGNVSTGQGTILLQQARNSQQHKIRGNFLQQCGNCTFSPSKTDPSKITMQCACKRNDGRCVPTPSAIDLNIGNIDVSPTGALIHAPIATPTSTTTATQPTQTTQAPA